MADEERQQPTAVQQPETLNVPDESDESLEGAMEQSDGISEPNEPIVTPKLETEAQEDEPPKKKMSTKAKVIIACIAGAVVIAAIIVGVVLYQQAEQARIQQEAEQAAQEAYNTYVSNMHTVAYGMLSGGADAESLGNTVVSVWNNAIWNGKDQSKWPDDEKAYFSDDFNTSLTKLYADSATQSKVSKIKAAQDSAKTYMSALSNPPSDLLTAYNTLTEMYDSFTKLTNLAISPSGSYQTYSADFREADNDLISDYNKLEVQMPK